MYGRNEVSHSENYRYRVILNNQRLDPTKPYTYFENVLAAFNGETLLYETEGKKDIPMVAIFSSEAVGVFERYYSFGRTAFPISIRTAKLLGKETIGGTTYSLLHLQVKDRSLTAKVWVDPNKGFCFYKKEYYDLAEGKPRLSVVILNEGFYQFAGGVWYPTRRKVTRYNKKNDIQSESHYVIKEAEFNNSFPSDYFAINLESVLDTGLTLSPGSEIRPQRLSKNFSAAEPGLLECGPRSLMAVCEMIGKSATLSELAELSDFSPKTGTTMLGLYRAAQAKGLNPVGMKGSLEDLRVVETPVIAHVGKDHFLVVKGLTKNQVHLEDSVNKYSILPVNEFEKIWDGYFLMFKVNQTGKEIFKEAESAELAPRVYVEAPVHEFGEVLGGTVVEHVFTFVNRGNAPLELADQESSCRCTVGFLSEKHIPAGKNGKIKVTFKVPTRNGEVVETVRFRTNDPNRPSVELTVKAIAKTPLTTVPSRLFLGRFSPSPGYERRVTVLQNLDSKARILGSRTTSDYIVAKASSPEANGNVRIAVEFRAGIPIGNIDETLLIDYIHKGIKTAITIPILGQVLGDFEVFPRNLFFGAVDGTQTVQKEVTISSTRDFYLRILGVKSKSKYISTEIVTVDVGRQYRIETFINQGAPEGELVDHLVITTNSETQPQVTIPLYCVIKSPE